MVCREDILTVLRSIDDPEMPISIVDLGLVEHVDVTKVFPDAPDGAAVREAGVRVRIDLLPTFVGCHALPMMEREIRERIGGIRGVDAVEVRFLNDPPWSVDRITDAGRESLRRHGVTVPTACHDAAAAGTPPTVALGTPRPTACPYCGSSQVRLESAFGPTRCRMIYYCISCRNSFEHLKRV